MTSEKWLQLEELNKISLRTLAIRKLNSLLTATYITEKKIDDDAYVNKKKDLEDQSSCLKRQLEAINDVEDTKKDLENRINSMREMLENGNTMNDFDRQVFESIVDYVIVGGYDDDGNADPYKITFVYYRTAIYLQLRSQIIYR